MPNGGLAELLLRDGDDPDSDGGDSVPRWLGPVSRRAWSGGVTGGSARGPLPSPGNRSSHSQPARATAPVAAMA
ncbi:MAG: hypothetical protein ACK5TO_05555, partial [Planctomycetaceae bacterium]